MQLSTVVQDDVANDMATTLNAQLGSSAVMEFFDGSMPANCETADAGTLVASCAMFSTPFTGAAGLTFNANSISPDTNTDAGTVQYYRMKDSGGTVIAQGLCGTSGSVDIVFDNNVFLSGDTLTVTGITLTYSLV